MKEQSIRDNIFVEINGLQDNSEECENMSGAVKQNILIQLKQV